MFLKPASNEIVQVILKNILILTEIFFEQMALTTKIEKLNGQHYYRDQWSGTLMKTRYGIPREKGHARAVTLKGTFKDPAAAVAWVDENTKNGNLNAEKSKKYFVAIHEDLDLSKLQAKNPKLALFPAPKINPENPDFSYQLENDYMMHPRSGYTHISVEEIGLKESQAKREKKSDSQKLFRFYTIDPSDEGEESPAFLLSAEKNSAIDLTGDFPVGVRRIIATDYKGKPCILLSEEDSQQENNKIASMFKKHDIKTKGRCHLIIQKPLHDDGVEEGKVTLSLTTPKSTSPKKKRETKEEVHLKIDNEITTQFFSNGDSSAKKNDTSKKESSKRKRTQ